jgi:hypothetical protein
MLSTVSARAQSDRSLTGSGKSQTYAHEYDSHKERQKVKAGHHKKLHEKIYRDRLDSIPDSNEEFDPWKDAR